jgi:hypothetical protein
MYCLGFLVAVVEPLVTLSVAVQSASEHPWRPPFGLERVGYVADRVDPTMLAEFEADAQADARPLVNPVDLGTILVPTGWLVLTPDATAEVTVAALSRRRSEPGAQLRIWFASAPDQVKTVAFPMERGKLARQTVTLSAPRGRLEKNMLHVVINRRDGATSWQKQIPVMLVHEPPRWPRFGAVSTKLRYDAPISVRGDDGTFSTMDYDRAWPHALSDVVVSFPNAARFVFWRGASYVPFWASRQNTGLSYEWAETSPPKDGFVDCVEPLMDKELRYGRVEIVESTSARVHVRWTYQSCDFKYKIWGDSAAEDFFFYPDGFGTRVLTLQSAPDGDYELSEFIILTPQGAYPLNVLPANLVDIVFIDGATRQLTFPSGQAEQSEKLRSRDLPALFRVRFHRDEPTTAVYFHPTEKKLPQVAFAPFEDGGQVVTPCYWGSHWPLARGQTTGGSINDRIHHTPCHNSLLSWARERPAALREARLQTIDTLGRAKPMVVQTWAWLIGLSDAPNGRLLDWARSFSTPPSLAFEGARLDTEPFVPERRAIRIVAERPSVTIALTPSEVCVNPVFEIRSAPRNLTRVSVDGSPLNSDLWTWDGRTLWLDLTLHETAKLNLEFAP